MSSDAFYIIVDSSRGIYIPQYFAESAGGGWSICGADRAILLAGPDHEDYWGTWSYVVDNATYIDDLGLRWLLVIGESGDIFACCEALMTDDEHAEFFNDVGGR